MKFFMKKSIFFLKKNGFFDPHPTYWIFRSFFSKILKIPAGEAHLFFLQTFVAVATSTENGRCTGKYGSPCRYVIFFTIYKVIQRMTSPLS